MRLRWSRPVRWSGVLGALVLACGLGLWGCGSPQKAGKSPIRGAERILVAPVNLAVRLSPVLEDAVEPVREALIQYLQGRGADVSLVWGPDAWNLWRDAVAKVSGSNGKRENFDAIAGVFVRELNRHAEFQLLVMPSLVYRGARVRGHTAQWDGVRRRVKTQQGRVAGAGCAVLGSQAGETYWDGEIPALSLHVRVFQPEGRRVYEGWGGIGLTHAAELSDCRQSGGQPLVLQSEFFQDTAQIREGVAAALDAYTGAGSP